MDETYGNWKQFQSLATELDIDIAYWDETSVQRLKNPHKKWGVFTPSKRIAATPSEIMCRNERPVIHVAWSGETERHFEAYVNQNVADQYELPEWLGNAIEDYDTQLAIKMSLEED